MNRCFHFPIVHRLYWIVDRWIDIYQSRSLDRNTPTQHPEYCSPTGTLALMTSCNPHFAHPCLVTLYPIPTDPPDGSPSCSVEPALNHTSLKLLCSWPGGFPSPSLHWTGDLKRLGQDEAGTGKQANPLTNTTVLLSTEGLASNDSSFSCMGSHLALKQSRECSTRTCKGK